jgi:hypothetical protein
VHIYSSGAARVLERDGFPLAGCPLPGWPLARCTWWDGPWRGWSVAGWLAVGGMAAGGDDLWRGDWLLAGWPVAGSQITLRIFNRAGRLERHSTEEGSQRFTARYKNTKKGYPICNDSSSLLDHLLESFSDHFWGHFLDHFGYPFSSRGYHSRFLIQPVRFWPTFVGMVSCS